VVEEAHRVLRPGGTLILSTVLLYELHGSPHDYYRFTASALEDLARPFERARLIVMGNRFVAAYDLLAARSVLLNSLLGRIAFRLGTKPSPACPTGFLLVAHKAR
jgi:SAM-dependent methyltransferase